MPRDLPPPVHLITAFHVRGGSQERTLQLGVLLGEDTPLRYWSQSRIDPHYRGRGVRRIQPLLGLFPRHGTLVFVGTAHIGLWVKCALPRRIILVHNTLNAATLRRRLRMLSGLFLPCPEVVFCSPLVAADAGVAGQVHLSPIDLERFRPSARPAGRPFTVGRLSRDTPIKFGPDDPRLFRALGAEGIPVRLMGASCVAAQLAGAPGVELLPVGAEDPAAFLGSLDCLLYRTAADWPEPYGRVVAEAMACGLPVVCHRAGGYANLLVQDGRTGFLYSEDEEAAAIVRRLRDDPALRARIGAEARGHVERLYGTDEVDRMRRFYLG